MIKFIEKILCEMIFCDDITLYLMILYLWWMLPPICDECVVVMSVQTMWNHICPVCLTVVILFVPFGRLTTECANGYQGPFTYHPLVQINSHFYIYGNPWSTWNLHIERVLNRRYTLVCWFSASSIHISLVLAIHMKTTSIPN